MIEIRRYRSASNSEPFTEWLAGLKDKQAKARISVRLIRLQTGNFGDCKTLRDGEWELRVDYGPGYRVYYAWADKTVVLLLCGGDKRKQRADIERAVDYWKDYQERTS